MDSEGAIVERERGRSGAKERERGAKEKWARVERKTGRGGEWSERGAKVEREGA